MGRGDREAAFNQEEANRRAIQDKLDAEVRGIPTDLTPAQRAGITQARLGGIDIAKGVAENEALRRSSAIGNVAGVVPTIAETERAAGREKAMGAAELQQYFAEVPVQRRLARAGIYLPELGQATQMAGSLAPPASQGLFSQIMQGVGAGAGAVGLSL